MANTCHSYGKYHIKRVDGENLGNWTRWTSILPILRTDSSDRFVVQNIKGWRHCLFGKARKHCINPRLRIELVTQRYATSPHLTKNPNQRPITMPPWPKNRTHHPSLHHATTPRPGPLTDQRNNSQPNTTLTLPIDQSNPRPSKHHPTRWPISHCCWRES
jgi:hypothetical protein